MQLLACLVRKELQLCHCQYVAFAGSLIGESVNLQISGLPNAPATSRGNDYSLIRHVMELLCADVNRESVAERSGPTTRCAPPRRNCQSEPPSRHEREGGSAHSDETREAAESECKRLNGAAGSY